MTKHVEPEHEDRATPPSASAGYPSCGGALASDLDDLELAFAELVVVRGDDPRHAVVAEEQLRALAELVQRSDTISLCPAARLEGGAGG